MNVGRLMLHAYGQHLVANAIRRLARRKIHSVTAAAVATEVLRREADPGLSGDDLREIAAYELRRRFGT